MNRAAAQERPAATPMERADRARMFRRFVAALFGVALGAFLALALSPRSHWLVSAQMTGWMPADPDSAAAGAAEPAVARDPISRAALSRAAARMPEDAEAQAAMLNLDLQDGAGPGTRDIPRALDLAHRYPNDPAIQAAALRIAWIGGAHMALGDIAPLLRIAEAGRRLDPRNAFFSAMRMGLLFEVNRPEEALSALSEAAALPRWNTYVVQQVHGAWRLSDAAAGKDNTAVYSMMAQRVSFSHLVPLTAGGRAAARRAADLEAGGRTADGYAIRRALMRLGQTIRSHDATYIGAMVGVTIQKDAMLYLPGAREPSHGVDSEAIRQKRFDDYLKRAGYSGDIAWVHRQYAAWDAINRVADGVATRRFRGRLVPFSDWYRAGAFLLKAAWWLGLAAVVAAVLSRWRWAGSIVGGYREFATFCVFLMSILLLAHGLVSLNALRAATQTNSNLETMVQNEGRFYADLTGRPWPR